MTKDQIIILLDVLSYKLVEGKKSIYAKSYDGYTIQVDLSKEKLGDCKIDYGSKIICNRNTTNNFTQGETLVVLECVDRLLTKGYKPEQIELEKDWKLGHKGKGFLDILLKDTENKARCMIECKTFGSEYQKELEKMNQDGGQLFSYFSKEKTTQYLCLYSSKQDIREIIYENAIIPVGGEKFQKANNDKEFYEARDGTFETKGLFEQETKPYKTIFRGIIKSELKELKQEDGGRIFNGFAEILRRNVVSDKSNAFNKMFNLFLCKIVDEDTKSNHEEMDFQRKKDEEAIDVLLRLNDLYKRSTKEYLNLEISDYTEEEIEKVLKNSGKNINKIKEMMIHLRLYKNNEFAFKEVFDEKSFIENSYIVKETMKLLEQYRLKYTHKQPFLSTFFEKLLNTGFKQEAGQFFTPIPLAKFMCNSIPFEDIISNKIANKDQNFLPYIIDYASGSGHFLTETMDRVDAILKNENIVDPSKLTKPQKDNHDQYKISYKRAKEFVYGIEKDYRLAKTTKVSCFLNGDGEAHIICGDGLGSFSTSLEYQDQPKLRSSSQDNQVFDCIIANPPYSVSGFKNTLRDADQSFSLYSKLSNKSSEIECFFVERTKQLLVDNGNGAIILPVSILNNSGIYKATREIILKYFNIKAIVELGRNTFMATGTNTIILFLNKRNNEQREHIQIIIKDFFKNRQDVTCNGIENSFSTYAKTVYDVEFKSYIQILQGDEKNHHNISFLKEYRTTWNKFSKKNSSFIEWMQNKEKEKLLYRMLTYLQTTIVVKAPSDNKAEKEFLGYEFSNRKGYEGIKYYTNTNDKIISNLYNEDNIFDSTKVNYYIYQNIQNKKIGPLLEDVKSFLEVRKLWELLNFESAGFDKAINTNKSRKIVSKRNIGLLGEHSMIRTGKKDANYSTDDGKYPFFTCGEKILQAPGYSFDTEAILVAGNGNVGECKYYKGKFEAYQRTYVIDSFSGIDPMFCFYYLRIFFPIKARGDIQGSTMPYIRLKTLTHFQLPIPPLTIQQKIVDQIQNFETKQETNKKNIESLDANISNIMRNCFEQYKKKEEKIKNITLLLKRGKSPRYGKSNIQVIKSGQARGYLDFDFSQKHFVDTGFPLDERKLQKGDVLLNSTGIGTAGRVTLFDLDGDFIVDSHITIIRVQKNIAYPKYILYAMGHIGFKNLESMAQGQSGQIELSLSVISEIKIPLPPIEEQHNIAAQIEKIEEEKKKLKKEVEVWEEEKKEILEKELQV